MVDDLFLCAGEPYRSPCIAAVVRSKHTLKYMSTCTRVPRRPENITLACRRREVLEQGALY